MKTRTFNIALCGIIASLSVVIMLSTALIPVATYAAPALAGIILAVPVIEINKKWAFASFAVAAAVSAIIVPDKEAVAFFVLFFGYYPILKQAVEAHIKNKWLQLLIKILCFSAAAVATYFIAIYLLGISSEEFTVFGINLPIIFLLAGIIVFVIFDNALSGLIAGYVNRLRQKIFGNIKSNTKL